MQEYCATALHTVDPAITEFKFPAQTFRFPGGPSLTVEEGDGGVGEGGGVPAGDGLALRRVAGPGAVRVAHPRDVACKGGWRLLGGSFISYIIPRWKAFIWT